MTICSVEGCHKPVHGRGLCDVHWYHWHKYGDPLITMCRPKGAGHKRPDGYIAIVVDKVPWLEHRYVWTQAHGPIPPKHHIHHRNGIKDDNRLENLELIHIALHGQMHSLARPRQRHSAETRAKLSAIRRARKGLHLTFCTVEGCGLPSHARHLCNRHYIRWRKFGSADAYHKPGRHPITGRLLPASGGTNLP